MEKNSDFNMSTREGLREEESLHASQEACCSTYYGGSKNHSTDTHDDSGKRTEDTDLANELVLGGASLREARVVLSRYEDCERFLSPVDDSDSQSVASMGSPTPRESSSRTKRKRLRNDSGDGSLASSGSESEAPAAKVGNTPRRGRGRPPTTGEYAGLAAAKAALVAAEREELQLTAEKEVAAMSQRIRSARSTSSRMSESSADRGEPLVMDLTDRAMECITAIVSVAVKSGNLKGTFVRTLKDSANSLREIIGDLRERTTNEETEKLQRANSRLQTEVAELRKEIVELRRDVIEGRAATPSAARANPGKSSQAGSAPEELEQRLVRQVGEMMNARLAALEERLLPEKRARPPLAADLPVVEMAQPPLSAPGRYSKPKTAAEIAERRRKILGLPPGAPLPPAMDPWLNPPEGMVLPAASEPETSDSVPAGTQVSRVENENPQPSGSIKGKGKGKGKKSKVAKTVASTASEDPGPSHIIQTAASSFAGVVKGGSQKTSKKPAKKAVPKQPKATRKHRLRIPRTSVVIMTMQPGAGERGVTYAKVLEEAKRQINPEELGIQSVKFRHAATGGRVLELAGENNAAKADALANSLRAVLNPEDIRVSRPEKSAELRLSGLDDSVSKVELAEAIQRIGGCCPDSLRVKDIRRNAAGVGTTFVQCPTAVAKKLAQIEKIKVGWVMVRVKLLDPRPLRCFRCLEVGHVREQCKSPVDRGSQCYRCGQPGHKAAECSAEPHCTLCAAAKKPAEHRIGGKACPLPPPKRKGRLPR